MNRPNSRLESFVQKEINWDKIDIPKFVFVGAGLGVTVALYPASVVKTRLQVAERNAFSSVIKGLVKNAGFLGLYRGFGVFSVGLFTGLRLAQIMLPDTLTATELVAFKLVEPFKFNEPTQAAIAVGINAMTASLFSQALFSPFDVISQKLMVQGYSGHAKYTGYEDVLQKIKAADGVRGLYRGSGLSVMTYSLSTASWWASYGSSQRVIWRFLGYDGESEVAAPTQSKIMLVQACGGIIAGATASLITTPLDTIKTRLQVMEHQDKRPSARQVVKNLIADDGYKGFYRGLGPRFFSMSAWGTSIILSFEYLKRLCAKDD